MIVFMSCVASQSFVLFLLRNDILKILETTKPDPAKRKHRFLCFIPWSDFRRRFRSIGVFFGFKGSDMAIIVHDGENYPKSLTYVAKPSLVH